MMNENMFTTSTEAIHTSCYVNESSATLTQRQHQHLQQDHFTDQVCCGNFDTVNSKTRKVVLVPSALLLESGKVQQVGMRGNTRLGNDCEEKFEQNCNGLTKGRHQQPALTKHDTEDFNTESHVSMHSANITGHLEANEQKRTIEHCN